jgi:8-oxo-dGTP pyrophosphatase MutT (NUDIX family)
VTFGPGAAAPWAGLGLHERRYSVADVRDALASAGVAHPTVVEANGFDERVLPAALRATEGRIPRPSAVLAPLYDHAGEAWVVLTRRSVGLRAHSGEVSFPGGRQEPGDLDLAATALREAQEETGLDPASVELIGELDHLSTITSGSFIVPFVGALPGRPELHPNAGEVDAILHVALSELLLPEVFHEELWLLGEVERPLVFFEVVGDTIWGATAAMLRQLLGFVTRTVARGEMGHD